MQTKKEKENKNKNSCQQSSASFQKMIIALPTTITTSTRELTASTAAKASMVCRRLTSNTLPRERRDS
ncbi:uncharacterized protein CIMG_03940 [Coccidioides immitis RS]|uniref:Uncharacterized protein n=4 Tax=Coccidioides immitis TaxID=5501 RepID=A0A0E1RXX9_COCIM|nr:uncharacterized protein CIMG_03940 [Coccidioides immitis RS]EAS32916.1 hypothetical protein CIMG_03940 [Coccidioides immitis RS]KMP08189.1 hypothetical protein CIRG_07871 [Coccidioides immitis RMSCC 2394]KMU79532.1 hypothetical protein CISG_01949 [Coccidioides immitis RMSCC 3703]KMU89895.1 hypothetical protein CIHG_07579 [Coccidioides immitis H538.4]